MSALAFRRAVRADVGAIVHLLADDVLGRTRERDEDPLPPAYLAAFEAIDADPGSTPNASTAASVSSPPMKA